MELPRVVSIGRDANFVKPNSVRHLQQEANMQLHVISVTRLLNTSHLPEGVCTIPQQLLKHMG